MNKKAILLEIAGVVALNDATITDQIVIAARDSVESKDIDIWLVFWGYSSPKSDAQLKLANSIWDYCINNRSSK